jgi:hypothetical protein
VSWSMASVSLGHPGSTSRTISIKVSVYNVNSKSCAGHVLIRCTLGHFERVPYDRSTVRSAYHTRKYDIHRLSHLTPRSRSGPGSTAKSQDEDQVDIFLSHDWPVGITSFGDEKELLRRKKFFAEEVSREAFLTIAIPTSPIANTFGSFLLGPDQYPRFSCVVTTTSTITPNILVFRSLACQVLRYHPSGQITRP